MEVPLAIAAAILFALGTVLQQRAAMGEEVDEAKGGVGAGLLMRLVRRPVWLAGIAFDAIGFGCQAAALGIGRLAVVQPLLALQVVFALPLGARLSHQRIGRREIAGAGVVTAGLALFLILSNPSGGRDDAPFREWAITFGAAIVLCGGLVLLSRGRRKELRAALLGSATGILWGVSAALTKATVDQLDDGFFALIADWHLYALLVVGFFSISLAQASLQVGALAPAIATQSIFDPIASVILGVTLLQEHLDVELFAAIGSCVALLACCGGLVALARSPIVQEQAAAG
jgi:drug/metabolite transporter (DMT)-like permease